MSRADVDLSSEKPCLIRPELCQSMRGDALAGTNSRSETVLLYLCLYLLSGLIQRVRMMTQTGR